ncbi:hypothetical protein C8Q79DRAFT_969855 [Trametes meyenii]|nr:hypothetical protein C8Q79DRAFT_969855 [Trametes meyenii]
MAQMLVGGTALELDDNCILVPIQAIQAFHDSQDHRIDCRPPLDGSRFECGVFDVPLDWANPSLGSGQIYYTRLPASAGVPRKGTIFVDPGEVGIYGISTGGDSWDWLQRRGDGLHDGTDGEYDIVVWDARGLGSNNLTIPGPVQCFNSAEEKSDFYSQTSKDMGIDTLLNENLAFLRQQQPEDAERWLAVQSKMVEYCLQKQDTTTLRYVGTVATVRDLVAMADAFDGPGSPIIFWGMAYGARIGSYLIQMFPDRVGRILLDAPQALTEDHVQSAFEVWRKDVAHANDTLTHFVKECSKPSKGSADKCSLGNSEAPELAKPFNSFRIMLTFAQMTYLGWRNAADVDLHHPLLNRAFNSFEPMVFYNETLSVEDTIVGLNRFLQYHVSIDLGIMPIVCGDVLPDHDVDTSSRAHHDVVQNLRDDIRNSRSLIMTASAFPPLRSLCHLWPVRATERLFSDPQRTVKAAHSPLIVQYMADPLARRLPMTVVLPGIPNAHTVVQMPYAIHHYIPHSCVGQVISKYLWKGKLPKRWCFENRPGIPMNTEDDLAVPAGGTMKTWAAAPILSSWRKFTGEDGSDVDWVPRIQVGLVLLGNIIMVALYRVVQKLRYSRGAVRLAGEDALVTERK